MADLADVLRPRPYTQQLTGIVTAVAAGTAATLTTATVDTGGGVCRAVPCLAGTTPAVGDVVLLLAADRRLYVVGRLSHPAAPAPLPPTPPADTTGTAVFPAVTAGTYLAGVWRTDRTDVVQGPDPDTGEPNAGVWRYGGIPAGTLAGATVLAVEIFLVRWPPAPAADVTVGLILHDQPAHTGTPPAVLDTATVPGVGGAYAAWVPLPTDWATDIIDPASPAAGIGVQTVGPADLAAFASLTADPQSGALSIVWSR
jgi:hypothetical protein